MIRIQGKKNLHLKKQIEFYKTDPFLASFYRSSYYTYGSNSYSGYNGTAGSSTGSTGNGAGNGASTGASDDYKSKHYGHLMIYIEKIVVLVLQVPAFNDSAGDPLLLVTL